VTSRFGAPAERVIFVSSNRWDVMGAAAFGFRPVWINRARVPNEYPEHAPVRVVGDLSALPSLAL
jgi:2-haloacid dehalogenase